MNLNPRYALFAYDINLMKEIIKDLDPVKLLDLCPRMKVAEGSIFYHSSIFASHDIVNHANEFQCYEDKCFYPPNMGCNRCTINHPVPYEYIGEKPRITELTQNPNVRNGKICTCRYGRSQRMYGNFNFIGNYQLDLQRQIKGTEIMSNISEMILLDMNIISLEIGFSPKRFVIHDNQAQNKFGEQKVWKSYCYMNNLDGLILLDLSDVQKIEMPKSEQTRISCYSYNENILCPEFVLIHQDFPDNIGTDKLRILGMIDLYDKSNTQLSRNDVKRLYDNFLCKLEIAISSRYGKNVKINLVYIDNSIIKNLMVMVEDKRLNIMDIINTIYHSNDLYLNTNNTIPFCHFDIFSHDVEVIEEKIESTMNLDLKKWLPEVEITASWDIHEFSSYPKNSPNFYYKDGTFVESYASDKLFDYVLGLIADKLNINNLLYTNYHFIHKNPGYEAYTLEEFTNQIMNSSDKQSFIRNKINTLEHLIISNFMKRCMISSLGANNNNIIVIQKFISYIIDRDKNIILSLRPHINILGENCNEINQHINNFILNDKFLLNFIYKEIFEINPLFENIKIENLSQYFLAYIKGYMSHYDLGKIVGINF